MGEHAVSVRARRDARVRDLVDEHFDLVFRTLCRFGVRDADDAAQRVFCIAASKLDDIDEGRARSFLFSIARRVAADARRAESRRREIADEGLLAARADASPTPEELSMRREEGAIADHAFRALPSDLRSAFELYAIEELSAPEVASRLGVPVGTVASRVRRAREELRDRIDRARNRTLFVLGVAPPRLFAIKGGLAAIALGVAAIATALATSTNEAPPLECSSPPRSAIDAANVNVHVRVPVIPARAPAHAHAHAPAPTPSLSDELLLLESARSRLSSSDPHGALAALDAYAARFPHGQLAREASVLRSAALRASP